MTSAPSTWRWLPARGRSWPPLPEPVPTIVAEALHDVPEPLRITLDPGPFRPPTELARNLAGSLLPPEAADHPPPWLRPDQHASFRRVLAALDRHHGALLADPVGSGKTWVALAVADARAGRRGAVAIVPAALRAQWQDTAARLSVPLTVHSHETLSRGRLPEADPRLVIVDECHHFRNPEIRRYRLLARWLVGRRVLLLSATPVVNRLADLAHQLRLGIRDDALAARGVPDLPAALAAGRSHAALGDLVISRAGAVGRPGTRRRTLETRPDATDGWLLAGIGALTLSTDPGIAALIRVTLWRALGSSRRALRGALVRYLNLLDHAASAAAAGRRPTRADIRSLSDQSLSQLVLWPLLPPSDAPADLVPADRPAIEELTGRLRLELTDERGRALVTLLGDRLPSVVFSSSRDTLRYLRDLLADSRPAWLSGDSAGIGAFRLPREQVLGHFRPDGNPPAGRAPTILLATDVAAEGLDLQRAGRIVHYDLPWTSVRLDQREGRAVRLGAERAEVEVVRFAPWPALEALLQQDQRLAVKRGLVGVAGLDPTGHWLFRWRNELTELAGGCGAAGGVTIVPGPEPGWLVGLALDLGGADGARMPQPAELLWLAPDGCVCDRPEENLARLRAAAVAPARPPCAEEREELLRLAIPALQSRLRLLHASAWLGSDAGAGRRRVIRRMRAFAAGAARRRDQSQLTLADQLLDWLGGGVTAGEAMLLEQLAEAPLGDLPRLSRRLLARPRLRLLPLPRLTGAIGVTSFRSCEPSGPCCSTSTAP